MMNIPNVNEEYGSKEYWDNRYQHESQYDWFAAYDAFRQIVINSVTKSDKILNLGCGNSNLSIDMYNDGFHNIVNIDYSSVVIENMQRKHDSLNDMKWIVMDAQDMSSLPTASFDVVLEKGTLDALLVSQQDPWRLSAQAEQTMHNIMLQISRLLKPNVGRFISVTFAQPHFRVPIYLQCHPQYDWDVTVDTFGNGFEYFVYTMRRGQKPTDQHLQLCQNYQQRKVTEYEQQSPLSATTSKSDDEDFLLSAVSVD
jgi:hypothetical protein